MLNSKEKEQYSRQIRLPELGEQGQMRLKEAKVLVIGCGGLGSPLLHYIASAGIMYIGLVDFDKIEIHNLHRQILYTHHDLGKLKVEVAGEKLRAINPKANIQVFNTKLTSSNALEIIKDFDIIADGTDNFPTRYLINDACVKLGKINVFASIHRFEGQLCVFNLKDVHGKYGANYRDLFPIPPQADTIPNCEEAGVIGAVAGVLGSLQANEVIKIASGIGSELSGKLVCINLDDLSMRSIKFSKKEDNVIRTENAENITLIDYDAFCGINNTESIKEITVQELAIKIKAKEEFQIIDVRKPEEYTEYNIGAEHIPAPTVYQNLEKLSDDEMVILHCKFGARSAAVIQMLQKNFDYENLYNLKGGIVAWKEAFGDKTVDDF